MSFLNKNKRSPSPNLGGYNEWKRQPGEFARKFSAGNDIAGFLRKQITVTEGEGLLLMQGGAAVSKVLLEPGVYDMGGYFKANSVSNASVAVLVDTGAVTLDFSGAGLKTKDGYEISYSMVISAKIIPEYVVNFHKDLMKGREAISRHDLESMFSVVVNGSIKAIAAQCYASEIREKSLGIGRQVLGHYSGIELTSVVSIDFDLGEWDRLQRSRADQKVAEERLKDGMRYNNLETAAKINVIENAGAIAKTEQGIDHDLKRTEKGFQLEIDRMQLEADIAEIKALQDLQARWNALKRSDQAELAHILTGLPPEVRFYVTGGTVADDLRFLEMKMMQSLTAEQILARNAVDPASIAAVANAIASKERLQDLERFSDKQLDQAERNAERMADITKTVLKTNAETTSAFAASMGPGTTVVTSGFGNPVAVNPPRVRYCPHCKSRMNADDKECPNCAYESD